MLRKPLSGMRLPLLMDCMRERKCVDGVRVSDGDVQIVFVRSRLISRQFCLSFND